MMTAKNLFKNQDSFLQQMKFVKLTRKYPNQKFQERNSKRQYFKILISTMQPEQTNPSIVGIIPRQAIAVKLKVTNGVQGKLLTNQTNPITNKKVPQLVF